MKTVLISTLVTLLFNLTLKSQITLENVYTNGQLQLCNLTTGGYKYYILDTANDQIKIYNTNHSIFRTLNVTVSVGGYPYIFVKLLSDKLFNTDNLIEYMIEYRNPVSPFNRISVFCNENNAVLLQTSGLSNFEVINIGGNYKLKKYSTVFGAQDTTRIFNLPGSLPCDACGGPTSIVKNNPTPNTMPSPYPNPTSTKITIPYTLTNNDTKGKINIYDINGKIIKEYNVDSTFDNFILDTQEFSAGTYYYNLITGSGVSEAKKIIVIN